MLLQDLLEADFGVSCLGTRGDLSLTSRGEAAGLVVRLSLAAANSVTGKHARGCTGKCILVPECSGDQLVAVCCCRGRLSPAGVLGGPSGAPGTPLD